MSRELVRRRYVVLMVWALAWFALRFSTHAHGLTDWVWFEFGARTLIHLNSHYATGALALYRNYPVVQIGPPPIAILSLFQWLSPSTVSWGFGLVMAALGVWCVRSAELIAVTTSSERENQVKSAVFTAGLVATAFWSWEAATWQHLDDAMAISFLLAATAVVVRRRSWWVAGLLVGLAIATKPWALVMAPVLMALPREQRARSAIVMMAATALPWLPFVIAAPGTVSALSGFHVTVDPRAAMHTLGLPLGVAPAWSRSLQLLLGLLATYAVVRRGRWEAVPVIALGIRVVTDPQSWPYYGIGPLIGALVLDAAAGRRVPRWTIATAMVEFGVLTWAPSLVGAAQLAWLAVIVARALLRAPERREQDAPDVVPVRVRNVATAR